MARNHRKKQPPAAAPPQREPAAASASEPDVLAGELRQMRDRVEVLDLEIVAALRGMRAVEVQLAAVRDTGRALRADIDQALARVAPPSVEYRHAEQKDAYLALAGDPAHKDLSPEQRQRMRAKLRAFDRSVAKLRDL